jgi:hypothetical protein
MKTSVLLVVIPVILVACANAPLPTTPTADNPCGVSYVACADGGKLTGMCCDEGTTCCDGSLCPAGMCEQIDNDQGLGKRKASNQWKAGTR